MSYVIVCIYHPTLRLSARARDAVKHFHKLLEFELASLFRSPQSLFAHILASLAQTPVSA